MILMHDGKSIRIEPTEKWQSLSEVDFFDKIWIEKITISG
jgi:hypothetical protein